jgi:hypothetical protein
MSSRSVLGKALIVGLSLALLVASSPVSSVAAEPVAEETSMTGKHHFGSDDRPPARVPWSIAWPWLVVGEEAVKGGSAREQQVPASSGNADPLWGYGGSAHCQ